MMVYLIYVSSKSFGFVFSIEVLKTFVIISDMYFQLKKIYSLAYVRLHICENSLPMLMWILNMDEVALWLDISKFSF